MDTHTKTKVQNELNQIRNYARSAETEPKISQLMSITRHLKEEYLKFGKTIKKTMDD